MFTEFLPNNFFPVGNEVSPRLKNQLADSVREGFQKLDFVGQWLFFKNRPYIGLNKQIPPDLIWDRMRLYASPIYTEYVEESENLDFLEIAPKFFEYLFWNDALYVGYETEGDTIELVEPPRTRNPGKFSLWYANTDVEQEDNNELFKFTNLITGEVVAVEEWENHFIKCTWNGYDENRYDRFYRFGFSDCCWNTALNEALETCCKRVNMHLTDATPEQIEAFKSNLSDLSSVLDITNTGVNVEPAVYMQSMEFKEFAFTVYHIKDRELYELGRVANTNPRGDRMTTGENYKDIIAIANRQRAVMNQLKLFSLKAADLWGVELDFRINGIPQRQGLPEDHESGPLAGPEGSDKNDKTPFH